MLKCATCGKTGFHNHGNLVSHARWCGKPFDEQAAFWDRLMPVPWSGCWIWMGPKYSTGYGVLWYSPIRGEPGLQIGAHRLAWILAKGDIPIDLQVLHRCDEPFCCNPSHLFLGTRTDNMADKMIKGRAASKLTPEAVRDIRSSPLSSKELAAMYGVGYSAIWSVRTGRKWRHVT